MIRSCKRCFAGMAAGLSMGACGVAPPAPAATEVEAEPLVEANAWAAISHGPTGPPAYLGNPHFGIRLGRNGFGYEGNEPLPAFILHDGGLLEIPSPALVRLLAGGEALTAKTPIEYKSHLDFKTGVRSVRWTEQTQSGATVDVTVETVALTSEAAIAQRITVVSDRGIDLLLREENPAGRVMAQTVSHGDTLSAVPPFMFDYRSNIADGIRVKPGEVHTFERTAWIIEDDRGKAVAGLRLSDVLPRLTYDDFKRSSYVLLAERWKTDIVIEGPVEDQQAIRSFLFYLYISGNEKLPPMALSSAKYHGHRFWDAEAWMLPVYALIAPGVARKATEWRLRVSMPGVRIPWETGADGSDVTPTEFRSALHVNGWVYWWLDRAVALGLADPARARRLQDSIAADFMSYASVFDGRAEYLNVMSPDEGRLRDNDLVTNLLAKYAAAGSGNQRFADSIVVPTAPDELPATFDNDHMQGYQQTAALLALFPLEWPFDREVSELMFDRYKGLTSDAGPAMSDSIHAVIAARLERPEEAYSLWHASWRPFVRPEAMLFSERRGANHAYFATGAAGCLQSVMYGFLGLRIEKAAGGRGEASKPLNGGYILSVRPSLPEAWQSITFKNLHVLGKTLTVHATRDTVAITEQGGD